MIDSGCCLENDFDSVFEVRKIWTGVETKFKSPEELKNKILEVVSFSFEGPLIPRKAISTVGFPHKEFFLLHDDNEYCLRLRKNSYKFYIVGSSHLIRTNKMNLDEFSWKRRFLLRNEMWLFRLHGNNWGVRYIRPFLLCLKIIAWNLFKHHKYFKRPQYLFLDLKYMLEGIFSRLPTSGVVSDFKKK